MFLAVALVLFAFTTSFPVLLASFMLWAVAAALMSGADLALLYDSLQFLGRSEEYERHAGRGEALVWAGAAVATLIGGPIAVLTSIQTTIFIGVAVTATAGLIAFAMVEAPHRADDAIVTRYFENIRVALRIAWRDHALRWLMVLGGILGAALGATMYLVQPLLLDRGVKVGVEFSTLQVPQLVAASLGALAVATLLRRVGEVTVLTGMVTCGLVAFVGLASVPTLAAFAFIPVIAMLESAIIPLTTGYVNRRAPSDQRATILSLESLSRGLFIAPLGPIVGAVADARGVEWAFATLGIALAAGALLALPIWVRAHRRATVPILASVGVE
jgi:cyanate permease